MKENYLRKEFEVSTDLSLIGKASTEALGFLTPLRLTEGEVFDIKLCLEEALINAMKYGNRLDKAIPVRLVVEYNQDAVRLTVEDQGSGFDPKKLADCTSGSNRLKGGGRGVYLIRQLMDEVRYNEIGNRILMVKSLKGRSKERTSRAA